MRRTQRSRRRLDIYRHTPTARTADSGGRSLRDLDLQKRLPESAALYDLQWDFREHAISRSRPCVWTFVWRLVREGSGPQSMLSPGDRAATPNPARYKASRHV